MSLIERLNILLEKGYKGNIGFEEMALFYKKANANEIKTMQQIIKDNDWTAYRMLISKVTGVALHP